MSQQEIPVRYLVLKPNHPIFQKLERVLDLMDELGITIYFGPTATVLNDKELTGIDFLIRDLDSEKNVQMFPPSMEHKMVRENPEYQKYQKQKTEEERLAREEKERQEKLAREEKELREELERKEQEEKRDLEMFDKLKKKWGW